MNRHHAYFLVLFALVVPFSASAECFSRNLVLGSVGEDVRMLQQIMNTEKETRIADSGPGSPGNESTYFGQRTRLSVIRFQERYRDEVLRPSGLSVGTGYVGLASRKKLEQLCTNKRAGEGTVANPTPSLPPQPTSTSTQGVYVFYPSEYSGVPGALRVISGDGFVLNAKNTVYFGPYSATGTVQSRSELLVFVPAIPPGKYPLRVENANGISAVPSFFIVRDPNVPEPTLVSLSPVSGVAGTKVRISGTGFATTKNTLHTGVNLIENVASQGGAIEWVVPNAFAGGAGTTTLPVWIYVVNDLGVSNPLVFQMKI